MDATRLFRTSRILSLLVCLLTLCPLKVTGAPTVIVEPKSASAAAGKPIAIKLNMPQGGNVSLKIFDAEGKFLRLLAQKHFIDKQSTVNWDLRTGEGTPVAAGMYTLHVDSGLGLRFDKTFAEEGALEGKMFVSPSILRLDKQGNLYVLDIPASKLFKFTADGAPANDWTGKNSITAASVPCWGGIAVEPDGSRIYLAQSSTTTHVVDVYDGKTGSPLGHIGDYFGDDPEWLKAKGGIAYPMWLGLNGGTTLYTDNPGYARIWAFDRSKRGKEAGLWQLGGQAAARQGWDSPGDTGDTDGVNAIYMASYEYHQRAQLFKIIDTGSSARFAYAITRYADPKTKKEVELRDIYGVAYDGEKGLWVIQRGPARVLKFADNGTGLNHVATFGTKGKNPSRLEFTAPRSAAASPDGKFLYIVEDGDAISKKDESKGPARVSRYKIAYADRKVIKLNVRP